MNLSLGVNTAKRAVRPLICVALLATASTATAQQAPPREGGAPAGALQLYPGVRFESGLDSNVAYANSSSATTSGTVVVNPYLGIATREPRLVDFTGDVGVAYERLLGGSSGASSQSGTDLEGSVGVRVNPNGVVSLAPSDRITWNSQPNYNLSGDPYRNLYNQFGLGLDLHPGGFNRPARMGISGGMAFTHRLWRYETVPQFDRTAIGGNLGLQWNFLPRTGVFFSGAVESTAYEEATFQNSDLTGALVEVDNADSLGLRGSVGFTGLLTRRLSLLVSGGYGVGNYTAGVDAKTYLTHIDFGVVISDRSQVNFGWEHNFEDTLVSSFLTYHRIYLSSRLSFGDLGVGASGYLNLNDFSPAYAAEGEVDLYGGDRNDTTVGGAVEFTYSALGWLTFGARYNPQFRSSTANFVLPTGGTGSIEYVSHRALAFVDLSIGGPLSLGGVSGSGNSWVSR